MSVPYQACCTHDMAKQDIMHYFKQQELMKYWSPPQSSIGTIQDELKRVANLNKVATTFETIVMYQTTLFPAPNIERKRWSGSQDYFETTTAGAAVSLELAIIPCQCQAWPMPKFCNEILRMTEKSIKITSLRTLYVPYFTG